MEMSLEVEMSSKSEKELEKCEKSTILNQYLMASPVFVLDTVPF